MISKNFETKKAYIFIGFQESSINLTLGTRWLDTIFASLSKIKSQKIIGHGFSSDR